MKTIHTFIICAYKESPYLKTCIESCINQSSVKEGHSNVMIYTSTPNTLIDTLAKKYQIDVFSTNGGGIGHDWNQALSFVTTKYATIAHQDDIYLPTYGTEVIKSFKHSEGTNIVFTDYSENDAQDQLRPRNINLKIKHFGLSLMSLFQAKWYQKRIYAFGNFISCPAVSYNMERLADFKFGEDLKMVVDWDAWERIMALPGKVTYIKQRLMYHRIHDASETTANTLDKNRETEEFMMYQRYWPTTIAKLLMRVYVNNQKGNQ